MKVKVIGTGSIWGEYNSACYLIDDNIMVDFPNGALKALTRLGVDAEKVDNILITHFHGDHYFDIPFIVLYKPKRDNNSLTLYMDKLGNKITKKLGTLAFSNSYLNACRECNLNFCNKKEFKINKYDVKRVLVDHGRMKPAYGYIFKTDVGCVGFTGDTSLCDSVSDMASKCNYLFCDCMKIKGDKKHMGIDNLLYLANKYPSCKFVPSHMDNDTRSELLKLNMENVLVLFDGQEVECVI